MIRFRAFGIPCSLHLLTLMLPPLCKQLGMKAQIPALIFALSLHELAHIAAAKLTGVKIQEIRLTPFGGSARMENPYGLRPANLAMVAAAGPACNLLCAVVFAALAEWAFLPAQTAAEHVQIHLTLFAFNLLPALPLDGGRILYCVLQCFFERRKALAAGIWTGRILAAALVFAAIAGLLVWKKLNLCLIMMAVFTLVSAQDEVDALNKSTLQELNLADRDKVPMRFYQISAEASILEAMRLARPKEANWFLLFKQGKPAGLLDGHTIAEFIRSGGASDTELGRLPILKFMRESNQSAQVHPRSGAVYQRPEGFR